MYDIGLSAQPLLALNLQFAAGVLCVACLTVFCLFMRRFGGRVEYGTRLLAISAWAAVAMLWASMSCELFQWFRHAFDDPVRARWASQAALSVLWSVYALALLGVGFWMRRRAVRFAALALFGLTALKLGCVDLWMIAQLARVLSFFALGLLMILAGYGYYRLEALLAPEEASEPPDNPG